MAVSDRETKMQNRKTKSKSNTQRVKTNLPYTSPFPILNSYHLNEQNLKNCFPSYCVKQYLSFLTCFFKSLPLPLLTIDMYIDWIAHLYQRVSIYIYLYIYIYTYSLSIPLAIEAGTTSCFETGRHV